MHYSEREPSSLTACRRQKVHKFVYSYAQCDIFLKLKGPQEWNFLALNRSHNRFTLFMLARSDVMEKDLRCGVM